MTSPLVILLMLVSGATSEVFDVASLAALAKHIHHPDCILQTGDPYQDILRVKKLSANFIFTTAIQPEALHRLVEAEKHFPRQTIVALDEEGFALMIMKKPNLTFFSKLSWFLLSPKTPNLGPDNFIPVDSRFWTSFQRNLSVRYQLQKGGPTVTQQYGIYSPLTGLTAPQTDVVLSRRNFQGVGLVVLKHEAETDPCVFDMDCFHYVVWKDFSEALNFSVKFVMRAEMNSNFGGKVDGQAGVLAFHILDPQENLVAPTFKGRVHLYISDPGSKANIWGSYVQPFAPPLWLTLFTWTFIFSLFLVAIQFLRGVRGYHLLPYIFSPLDALTNQGESIRDVSLASHVSVLVPRLLSVVIFPSYAAAIISFLAVHLPVYPFTDIQSFRKDGTYRLGSLRDSFSIIYIQNSDSWEMQEIARHLVVPQEEMPVTFTGGIARLCRDDKFAFLAYNNLVDKAAWCPVLRMPTPVTYAFAGLPIAKDFPYKLVFQMILLNYYSNGFVSRFENTLSDTYDSGAEKTFTAIELDQITVPLLILAAGMALAIFIFTLEQHTFIKSETSGTTRSDKTLPAYLRDS